MDPNEYQKLAERTSSEDALEENRDREAEREVLQPLQQDLDTVEMPEMIEKPNPEDVQPSRRSYSGLCCVCKKVRIYKHNTSGMCPDCAADERMKENLAEEPF